MIRKVKQHRTRDGKHPGSGARLKKILWPLLRAFGSGVLNGLCRLVKSLAITMVLALGTKTTDAKLCDCRCKTGVTAAEHKSKEARHEFIYDKEIERHEYNEHHENGCGT